MKKIVTIFENLEPVHLNKDVGMLPYSLNILNDFDVKLLATSKQFSDEKFEEKVKLKFINPFKSRKLNKIILFLYVLLNIKKIDVLMLFHPTRDKYILSFLAKLLNKNITTYIKMDTKELTAYEFTKQKNSILNYFGTKGVDYFTIETKSTLDILKDTSPFKDKIFYLPNGFSADKVYDLDNIPKEKMIIAVGRVGTPQKNSELFLSAIEQLENFGEYKFYFIGPVEQTFQQRLENLFDRRNDLKDKIILTGNITSKDELYSYYKRAEIVCFSSIYEGFSLAMIEACYFGCYLLSTDLGGAYDIADSEKQGSIVAINHLLIQKLRNENVENIVNYIDNNFEKIIKSDWFGDSSKLFAKEMQILIDSGIKKEIHQNIARTIFSDFNWNRISINLQNLLRL